MAQTEVYNRIFDYPPTDAAGLAIADPEEIERGAKSREIAAWELLLGSIQLRRAGQRSPANDWLNHATRLSVKDDVFNAELLGEVGQGLFESDRLQDAYQILNSAEAAWRDVCGKAAEACKGANKQAAVEFASHLLPLFAAAKAKPPASEAAIRSGTQSVPIVQQWLSQRAVMGRAQTTNAFLRLLAKAGKIDDARSVLEEELEWVALNFTSPAKPVAAGALEKRLMSSATRRALYLLLLAQGEIELAAGNFQESADGFGSAAAIYEGQVENHSDISRLLRAKSNQANSLLRLHRIKEAVDIYELCRHGFNSIDDSEAAQRVEHAIVLAKSMGADEDES